MFTDDVPQLVQLVLSEASYTSAPFTFTMDTLKHHHNTTRDHHASTYDVIVTHLQKNQSLMQAFRVGF